MKKFIIAAAAFLALSSTAYASSFCDGYKEGYKAGKCYPKKNCLPPMPPMCPMAGMGETSYQDGYNRGFSEGQR